MNKIINIYVYFIQFSSLGRTLFLNGDVASALSGNSLVSSRKTGAKSVENDEDDMESKMLLFNGLYFKGTWETPFQVYILIIYYILLGLCDHD